MIYLKSRYPWMRNSILVCVCVCGRGGGGNYSMTSLTETMISAILHSLVHYEKRTKQYFWGEDRTKCFVVTQLALIHCI